MRESAIIYQISDNNILSVHQSKEYLFTYNQKPADLAVRQSLVFNVTYQDHTVAVIPNISVLNAATGQYIGTIATPSELSIEATICNPNYLALVFSDPSEDDTLSKQELTQTLPKEQPQEQAQT